MRHLSAQCDRAGSLPSRIVRPALLGLPLLVLLGTCSAKPPPDPGLGSEDLGIGISLGLEPAAAKEAAPGAGKKAELWVLTPEELNKRNPYANRTEGQDLVVALYLPYITPGSTPDDPVGSGRIKELRCYLAQPAKSKLTLLGKPAATLSQEDLTTLFGPPLETNISPDGDTHLSYRYSPSRTSSLGPNVIKLVVSFHGDGSCYAFSISLQPR